MIALTQKQANQRFKTLPEVLQDALFSIQIWEAINRIATENHINDERLPKIFESISLVLMGFIHPEEIAKEIEDRTRMSPQISKPLSEAINNRVFAPIRSAIDKAYAPLPEEQPEDVKFPSVGRPPNIVEEIKQLKKSGTELVDVLKKEEKLKDDSDTKNAWSATPQAKPIQPIKIWSSVPPPPNNEPKIGESTPPIPSDKPMMIHEESEQTPLKPKFDFHLERPSQPKEDRRVESLFDRQPAKLEIGRGKPNPSQPARSDVIEAPKVVNYSSMNTPSPEIRPKEIEYSKEPVGKGVAPPAKKPSPMSTGFKPEPYRAPNKNATPIVVPPPSGQPRKSLLEKARSIFKKDSPKIEGASRPPQIIPKKPSSNPPTGGPTSTINPIQNPAPKIDSIKPISPKQDDQSRPKSPAPPPNLPIRPPVKESNNEPANRQPAPPEKDIIDLNSFKKI